MANGVVFQDSFYCTALLINTQLKQFHAPAALNTNFIALPTHVCDISAYSMAVLSLHSLFLGILLQFINKLYLW